MIHLEHVHSTHRNLLGFCPYCQKELVTGSAGRMSKKSTLHLKFCCFFHKVENAKFRRLFNNFGGSENTNDVHENAAQDTKNNTNTSSTKITRLNIAKTSVLTLQRLLNNSQFLLNVLQYEIQNDVIQTLSSTSLASQTPPSATPGPLTHETQQLNQQQDCYEREIQIVQEFHNNYTLTDNSKFPHWWFINMAEITSATDVLVARNSLTFDDAENIDCKLVRIMSLHWYKYSAFKYTIEYNNFVQNIDKFKCAIRDESFIIARYMCMYKQAGNANSIATPLSISMVIIGLQKNCYQFLTELIPMSSRVVEIVSFDTFVDICFDLSNDGSNGLQFPRPQTLQLLDLNYGEDVLAPRRETIDICTKTTVVRPAMAFRHFFSPLNRYAKVYLYSQTKMGCVRAFDRLFELDNLANFITDVVYDGGHFYINYSSLSRKNLNDSLTVRLHSGDVFAGESYYRQQSVLAERGDLKIFLLNGENIKVVVERCTSGDTEEHNDELTLLPDCLLVTNIKYRLTPAQSTMYKVVQYHREKLLLEINRIPQVDLCCQ